MRKSFTFSAFTLGLLGTTSAMAATAGGPPLDTLMQPSTWVVVLSAAAMIGLALGQGPTGTLQPLKLRRAALGAHGSALPA